MRQPIKPHTFRRVPPPERVTKETLKRRRIAEITVGAVAASQAIFGPEEANAAVKRFEGQQARGASDFLRRAHLETLHSAYLQNPATSREALKAKAAYLKAMAKKEASEKWLAQVLKEQKQINERKRLIEIQAREANSNILKASARLKAEAAEVDKLAEGLVLTHGSAPIQLGGDTYDFGCYGERVWLTPRVDYKISRRGKR